MQLLKRASSVPTRVECEQSEDQQDSLDTTNYQPAESSGTRTTVTPSTTDENVRCISQPQLDPILSVAYSSSDPASRELLPHLPNITPVRGHSHYQGGWL